MALLLRIDEEDFNQFVQLYRRIEQRLVALEKAIEPLSSDITTIKEIIQMSVDPNVQQLVTDVANMGTALQAVLAALTESQSHIATLNTQIAAAQSAGLSAENVTALQGAATALEASVANAKSAVTAAPAAPTPAPSATPTPAPAATPASAPATSPAPTPAAAPATSATPSATPTTGA